MQYTPIKGMRFMLCRLLRRCNSWNVKRVLNGILLLILCNCLCFLYSLRFIKTARPIWKLSCFVATFCICFRRPQSRCGLRSFEQPLVGQGHCIIEASRSHSDTRHSVGFLWMSDQADTETCTWQHTTLTRDRHPCHRRDSNTQSHKQATADIGRRYRQRR
jgi:hypothetical protein